MFKAIINFFKTMKEDMDYIKVVLPERGFLFSLRPVIVGSLIFVILYSQFYAKGQKAIFQKKDAIEAKRIQTENIKTYLKDKSRFDFFLKHLPKLEDKSSWLLDTTTTILKKHKVRATKISEQREQVRDNFTVVNISITANITYQQMGKIIEDMENNDLLLRITSFDITKSNSKDLLNANQVAITIATIFYSPVKEEIM